MLVRFDEMDRAIAENRRLHRQEMDRTVEVHQQEMDRAEAVHRHNMIENERFLQEKFDAIDLEADRQRKMLKTVSDKVDKGVEIMERRL